MDAMDVALRMIQMGVIEVRKDGTIWKVRNLNATTLLEPRRLETKTKGGYLAIRVNHGGKAFMLAAHRVVWTVLNGPIPPGMDINHIDGKKGNNCPENMELATRSQNHKHAYSTGLRTLPRSIPKPILAQVSQSAKDLRTQGLSYSQIAERLGISQTTAFRAVKHE